MEHVVFFTENPGEPEFRRVGDLEAAVRLVETLRNERGIADVSVHALTPVPVSFRTYYRVQVGGVDLEPAGPAEVAEAVEPAAEPVVEPVRDEVVADEIAAVEVVADEVVAVEEEAPAVEVAALEVAALEVAALEVETPVESSEEPPALQAVALEPETFSVQLEDDAEVASLEVPSLEVPSFEVPSLADEEPVIASLALLPPPVEASPVFELDEPGPESVEPVAEVAEPVVEPADEFEALAAYEPLVPQVRPEPEPERSLGYFAN